MDSYESSVIRDDYRKLLYAMSFALEGKMSEGLLAVLQDAVFLSGHSASEIARGIRKPYSTLMRECNPYDKGAKLGVVTLFEIMDFTKNIEPLRYMASRMGYELTPKPEQE